MTGKVRVGVVYGGRSGEHAVSVASAQALIEALDRTKYEPVPLAVDREGRWHPGLWPDAVVGEVAADRAAPARRFLSDRLPATNGASPIDVVFPLVHGTFGEDGTLQGLLEMASIPYVGSGVLGSALGMDKWSQKRVYQAAGLPVAPYVAFRGADHRAGAADIHQRIMSALGLPVFVKPSNSGSSVGITKVKEEGALGEAIALALGHDRRVVVERAIACREIEVSVLGNDDPVASRPGEVRPRREWYDYRAKYTPGLMELLAPAPLATATEERIRRMAIDAFVALDASGMARVDFFLERETDRVFVNEINTIPGFTAMSAYSKLWEVSGLAYAALVDRLIELAFEAHRARRPEHLVRMPDEALGR